MGCAFWGLDDYRKDSTAPHDTFGPQLGGHRQCGLATCTFHLRFSLGFYCRPSTFRSRPIEWEETVHADTGMLGLTTQHIYFAGSRKKFRVRCDRIVSSDPYDDGFGIMRDAQTAKTADLPDGRRLVRLQPGHQPGPASGLSRSLPAKPGAFPAQNIAAVGTKGFG